jgi:hypothetical protein
MSDDLTNQARIGFHASPTDQSPYLRTSNSDAAWRIGAWRRKHFMPAPSGVRASRGDFYHVDGGKVCVKYECDAVHIY